MEETLCHLEYFATEGELKFGNVLFNHRRRSFEGPWLELGWVVAL